MKCQLLSHVWLFATPWPVAHQTPLSMEFSRQVYWSGLLFPSLGNFPDTGIKPGSPVLQADSLSSESPGDINNIITIDFDDQFLYSHIKSQVWNHYAYN